ncbi:MAG: hypothetical protein RR620_03840 [Clostridium sp.]
MCVCRVKSKDKYKGYYGDEIPANLYDGYELDLIPIGGTSYIVDSL